MDLKELTLSLLFEKTQNPIASENVSASGSLTSAFKNFSLSIMYMPYGVLFPFRTLTPDPCSFIFIVT
jgi:hypothetical protein